MLSVRANQRVDNVFTSKEEESMTRLDARYRRVELAFDSGIGIFCRCCPPPAAQSDYLHRKHQWNCTI